MAAFSRGLRARISENPPFLYYGTRDMTTSFPSLSGHNRWSKIKHDKGKADAQKNRLRSALSKELIQASKVLGSDPKVNPPLAAAIANARKEKAGFPKSSIESAIARGQGVSANGSALENVTLEALLPQAVAFVIDCQTDNKTRCLQELRLLVKSHGGTVTSTSYLFEKRGRLVFEKAEKGVDDILEVVVEADVYDMETDESGNILVFTHPSDTVMTGAKISERTGIRLHSSNIIYHPIEDTRVPIDTKASVEALTAFITDIQQEPAVQGIYFNAAQGNVGDQEWAGLQNSIDGSGNSL